MTLEEILYNKQFGASKNEKQDMRIVAQAVNEYLTNNPIISSHTIQSAITSLDYKLGERQFKHLRRTSGQGYLCGLLSNNVYLEGSQIFESIKVRDAVQKYLGQEGEEVMISEQGALKSEMILYYKDEKKLQEYITTHATLIKKVARYQIS